MEGIAPFQYAATSVWLRLILDPLTEVQFRGAALSENLRTVSKPILCSYDEDVNLQNQYPECTNFPERDNAL